MRLKVGLIAIALFLFAHFTDFTPSWDDTIKVKSEITQLYSGTEGKYSTLSFIVVYKDENGRLFDRRASAAFYSQAKVGQVYDLEVRKMDIYPEYRTGWHAVIGLSAFLLYAIAYLLAVSFAVATVLPNKDLKEFYNFVTGKRNDFN